MILRPLWRHATTNDALRILLPRSYKCSHSPPTWDGACNLSRNECSHCPWFRLQPSSHRAHRVSSGGRLPQRTSQLGLPRFRQRSLASSMSKYSALETCPEIRQRQRQCRHHSRYTSKTCIDTNRGRLYAVGLSSSRLQMRPALIPCIHAPGRYICRVCVQSSLAQGNSMFEYRYRSLASSEQSTGRRTIQ